MRSSLVVVLIHGNCRAAAPAQRCFCTAQGPRMVRDVFRLAKENEPAIIFIDEVDAIATARFDAQTGADRCLLPTPLRCSDPLVNCNAGHLH